MLDHLLTFTPDVDDIEDNFTPLSKTAVSETIDAKVKTLDWLKELGAVDDDEIIEQAQVDAARKTFTNIVTNAPAAITKETLADVKTPVAVQHLVGMLTAYDWEFVHQAQAIRGYCVAQLVEETKNPSANIRLKALGLLGKVTEIGLFTDKVEVKKTEMSDEDIEKRIKDKLHSFMQVVDVMDVKDITEEISTNNLNKNTDTISESPDEH